MNSPAHQPPAETGFAPEPNLGTDANTCIPAQGNKKPRVAVLMRHFSKLSGGAESYAVNLVEQLAGRCEFHVFGQTFGSPIAGVTYHALPFTPWWPRWLNQLRYSLATARATQSGFDVVHSHENTTCGNLQTLHVQTVKANLFGPGATRPRWRNALKVATSPRLWAYLWLERRRLLGLHRTVVFASSELRSNTASVYPLLDRGATDKAPVVTPGVTLNWPTEQQRSNAKRHWRTRLQLPENATLLLFAGHDFSKKGLHCALRALHLLGAKRSAHLLVAGRTEQRPAFNALLQELGLTRRVHFLGPVQDMAQLYHACQVLVHPTTQDAAPMVVLEAFGHGLAVVTTRTPYNGLAAHLTHAVDVRLIDTPRSPEALSLEINTLLENDRDLTAQQLCAYEFAKKREWAFIAIQQYNLYKDFHVF